MAQAPLTKEQLIEGLHTSEQQLIETLAGVDAADLETGCYENGWNAREVLAHVASMEWTYSKILNLAAPFMTLASVVLPASGEITVEKTAMLRNGSESEVVYAQAFFQGTNGTAVLSDPTAVIVVDSFR